MKEKRFISVVGAIALLLSLGMNVQYALEDYGISTNSLNTFILAQSNTSGGGSGSSSGSSSGSVGGITNPWFWRKVSTSTDCTAFVLQSGSVIIREGISTSAPGISASISGTGSASETVGYTYRGKMYKCVDGWEKLSCSNSCEP